MNNFQDEIKKMTKQLPYDPRILYKLLTKLGIEENQAYLNINYVKICENLQHCERLHMRVLENSKKVLIEKYSEKFLNSQKIDLLTIMSFLGYENIKNILFKTSMEVLLDYLYEADNIRWNFYKVHSITAGVAAEFLYHEFQTEISKSLGAYDFYSAGLFSNIGRIGFNTWKKEDYFEKVEKNIEFTLPETNRSKLEMQNYGTTHSVIGSTMAKEWGLPKFYENAALMHSNMKQIKNESLEIQLIMIANIVAFLTMPMVKYPENLIYIDFQEDRKKFFRKLPEYFSSLNLKGSHQFMQNIHRNTILLMQNVTIKSLDILKSFDIPPAGGRDSRIKSIQAEILKLIGKYKGVSTSIEKEQPFEVENIISTEMLLEIPIEISAAFDAYLKTDSLKEKFDIYKNLLFWITIILQNYILTILQFNKQEELTKMFYKNRISKFSDISNFLKFMLDSLDKMEKSGIVFYYLKTNFSNILRLNNLISKSNNNEERFEAILKEAMQNISQTAFMFKAMEMFEILDIDCNETTETLIYYIRKWFKSSSKETFNHENYETIQSKNLRSKGKFYIYFNENIINCEPWIIVNECPHCGKRHPFVFQDFLYKNKIAIYSMYNVFEKNYCTIDQLASDAILKLED
ncbi:HDOD domain-containing protein [Candidatus Gracilibacteria bacterium]|nr:HDOD domain-containing protein [Candidatus Gracilibacteria bacterium]